MIEKEKIVTITETENKSFYCSILLKYKNSCNIKPNYWHTINLNKQN